MPPLKYGLNRVLIASIKNLAKYLCPRCLTPKYQVGDLGTKNDHKRHKQDRVDDTHHQNKVARARRGIFSKGYKITGKKVEGILGDQSLAPIKVSLSSMILGYATHPRIEYIHIEVVEVRL
jgi:hypothetical protein